MRSTLHTFETYTGLYKKHTFAPLRSTPGAGKRLSSDAINSEFDERLDPAQPPGQSQQSATSPTTPEGGRRRRCVCCSTVFSRSMRYTVYITASTRFSGGRRRDREGFCERSIYVYGIALARVSSYVRVWWWAFFLLITCRHACVPPVCTYIVPYIKQ